MKTLFSVIVPVYNVEQYLTRCIESILAQTFIDYELILVNDGSTDSCPKICDEYARKDNRIKIIHKNNGGLSDARNTGMKAAKGQYLIFVDSDDYILPDALKEFYKELNKDKTIDVLITRLMQVYSDAPILHMDKNMPIDLIKNGVKFNVINWVFNKSQNTWPAQRYVVRRDLIEKENLQFARGYLHEDIDWTSRLFLYASSFSGSDYYWYAHQMGRKGSITTNKNVKRSLDIIELVSMNIRNEEYKKVEARIRDVMFKRMVKSLFATLSNYRYFNDKEKNLIIKSLYKNRDVLIYTEVLRHKLFLLFSKTYGFEVGLKIMNLIHK